MGYYCPNCGHPVDNNIFFQITGQCMCSRCGEIVDLLTVSDTPLDQFDRDFGIENYGEEEEEEEED